MTNVFARLTNDAAASLALEAVVTVTEWGRYTHGLARPQECNAHVGRLGLDEENLWVTCVSVTGTTPAGFMRTGV